MLANRIVGLMSEANAACVTASALADGNGGGGTVAASSDNEDAGNDIAPMERKWSTMVATDRRCCCVISEGEAKLPNCTVEVPARLSVGRNSGT